jgi:hypothetical protein
MVFALTEKRKRMPLDAERDPATGSWVPKLCEDANVADTTRRVPDGHGGTMPVVKIVPVGLGRWVSHFATCPNSAKHRRTDAYLP